MADYGAKKKLIKNQVLTVEELDKTTYRCGSGDQGVKIISTNCHKAPETETL
jgi:hypothetical protein